MKIRHYFLIILTLCAIGVKAQVTIGSSDAPLRGAVLELKSDTLGFIPTRVKLVSLKKPDPLPVHVEGMVVYNTTVKAAENLQPSLYLNTGSRWERLQTMRSFLEHWFYMPSIAIETSKITEDGESSPTINLYEEFKKQKNEAANNDVVASFGAPVTALSTIPIDTDFYYYVTAYDKKVFKIEGISEKGVMTYRILSEATDATFINIVFVEK